MVVHIYTHFRAFTLHIHSLLHFTVRTMCEAGRDRVHSTLIVFSGEVSKAQKVSTICSKFQKSKSHHYTGLHPGLFIPNPTFAHTLAAGTFTFQPLLHLSCPVSQAPNWLPVHLRLLLTQSGTRQNKRKKGNAEHTTKGYTISWKERHAEVQCHAVKPWASCLPSLCLNSFVCGIMIVPTSWKCSMDELTLKCRKECLRTASDKRMEVVWTGIRKRNQLWLLRGWPKTSYFTSRAPIFCPSTRRQ